jgi:hypothetical protein
MAENKRVASIRGTLFNNDQYIRSILKNNIFGVDLNEESVEITKLSLWLKSAEKGKKLTTLDENIKCGNSLIDDQKVAGNKAFKWEENFSGIMENGGFDVVVGNPPYTYRNSISDNERRYYKENYSSAEGNFDLYKFFTEKLYALTNEGGRASFIIPNTFLSALTYKKLRSFILEKFEIKEMYDLGLSVFEGVVVESLIFTFEKREVPGHHETVIKVQRDRNLDISSAAETYTLNISELSQKNDDLSFNIYLSPLALAVIQKTRIDTEALKRICYCTVRINTGYIKSELVASKKIDPRYNKMLNGKDIGRHTIIWPGDWIMYDVDFVKSQGDRGRSLPEKKIFDEDKILVQRTRRGLKRKLVCCYDSEKYYNLNRLSNIVLINDKYNLYYVYALLNSTLIDYYFNKVFNEYEVKPAHLNQLPIKTIDIEKQEVFVFKSKEVLTLALELHSKSNEAIDFIVNTTSLSKPTKKLKLFYKLPFNEFLKEIKETNASLEKKEEWYKFYVTKAKVLCDLSKLVIKLDGEIDDLVFKLYNLSAEEILTVNAFYNEKQTNQQ